MTLTPAAVARMRELAKKATQSEPDAPIWSTADDPRIRLHSEITPAVVEELAQAWLCLHGNAPAPDDGTALLPCSSCHNGQWETECCSGANGCDCRGQVVQMGRCNVCGGTGWRHPDADERANARTIEGRCFIGRGPTSGYWAGK